MSDDTNEMHTATLRQSITNEMRKRGLSPVLARSAASLMVAESAQPHEMTDGEPLVAMNGRVFTVDMAVTRWLASDGREFATDACAARGVKLGADRATWRATLEAERAAERERIALELTRLEQLPRSN